MVQCGGYARGHAPSWEQSLISAGAEPGSQFQRRFPTEDKQNSLGPLQKCSQKLGGQGNEHPFDHAPAALSTWCCLPCQE